MSKGSRPEGRPRAEMGRQQRTVGCSLRPSSPCNPSQSQQVGHWGQHPSQVTFATSLSLLYGGLRLSVPLSFIGVATAPPPPSSLHPNPTLCTPWSPHQTQGACKTDLPAYKCCLTRPSRAAPQLCRQRWACAGARSSDPVSKSVKCSRPLVKVGATALHRLYPRKRGEGETGNTQQV